MQHLDTLEVSAEVGVSIRRLIARLGPVAVTASPRWKPVVDKLGLGRTGDGAESSGTGTTGVVVGSPADVLKHAREATQPFGFVMPVAQIAAPGVAPSRLVRWGRGASSWRDDATLELWDLGWSPANLDRLLVPMQDATVELVIGDARRVPEVQLPKS